MGLATLDIFKQLQNYNTKLKKMDTNQLKKLQMILLSMAVDLDKACEEEGIKYYLAGGSCLGAIRHNGFIPWDDDMDILISRKDFNKLEKVFDTWLGKKYYLQSIDRLANYDLGAPKIRKRGTIYRTKDDLDKKDVGIFIDLFIMENTYDFWLARYLHGILSLSLGLICSCRGFYNNRRLYMNMAGRNRKIRVIFRLKIVLGFMVAWRSVSQWVKTWDKINRMCKNDKSRYVTVPVGRKHFFGEMHRRSTFGECEYVAFGDTKLPIMKNYKEYLISLYGNDYMEVPKKKDQEKHAFFELDFGDD